MKDIRLRNTLTRERDVFCPRQQGKVGLYVCGPTVYDHAHLGHARVYVVFDTLVRFLRSRGLEVTYVRNITDLDDKIIARAKQNAQDWSELAGRYTESFHEDMASLGVLAPTHEPRATDNIPEMIEIIERLIVKNLAYVVEGDVYYEVQAFERYGRLSGRNLDQMRAGARVNIDTRLRHPADFALWKSARPHEPSWPSPWGPGRPGWHIECSAMSLKYLGMDFDIHGGGMDLIFPHHENEIAQSEGASGQPFCRVFVHNGFVNVNREKMSKSLGNFFLVRQVFEHGHPEAVRLFLLGTHYHAPIDLKVDLDEEGHVLGFPQIAEAQKRIAYYQETVEKLEESARGQKGDPPDAASELCRSFDDDFDAALADDLNTAMAIGRLNDFLRAANDLLGKGGGLGKKQRGPAAALALRSIRLAAGTLGILSIAPEEFFSSQRTRAMAKLGITEKDVEDRLEARRAARASKDWAAADAIRDELLAMGIDIRDAGDKTSWRAR